MNTHSPVHQIALPRGLVLITSLWMIGSWIIAIGVRVPVHPSSASFTPSVRLMITCMVIGMLIGWPLLRLSQRAIYTPVRSTLLDVITLLVLMQIMLWPMRIVTSWPLNRVLAIDAAIGGWLLVASAIVASAIGTSHRGVRLLGIIACVTICLAGPLVAWLGVIVNVDWSHMVSLSPLSAVQTLGRGGGAPPTFDKWLWIALLWLAGGCMWIAMLISSFIRNRSRKSAY